MVGGDSATNSSLMKKSKSTGVAPYMLWSIILLLMQRPSVVLTWVFCDGLGTNLGSQWWMALDFGLQRQIKLQN
eukprot:scaffold2164_cov106-Cylindrotheca_fusiformis.AAC.2